MAHQTQTGIGRALRTARLRQGKSLEEASRETRLRTEQLSALEREAFEALAGDVYVRGFLRSYSRYLGLNPERVISFYETTYRKQKPPPAPLERTPGVGPTEAVVLTGGHRRPSWILAAVAAALALTVAGGIGLISRQGDVPEAATPSVPPANEGPVRTVRVDLVARGPVDVEVAQDDLQPVAEHLEKDEAVSFEADERIVLRLDQGGRTLVTVNGTELGWLGEKGVAFEATYEPSDFRGRRSRNAPAPGSDR